MKHLFKRKEEKFILSISKASEIISIVKHDLSFSQFNQNGSLTDIRTTYFDNDNFFIYHMKKNRLEKRYKIRIREYGKEGCFETYVWVELKEKTYGQGYKSRFKINRKYINDFISGKDVYKHVKKKNKGIHEEFLSVLYHRIQDLIIEKQMYPRLVIQYQRLALQEQNPQGARLTFDYNLKGGVLNKSNELFQELQNPEYFDKYKSIVELKIGNIYPEAAKQLKKRFHIKKQKFSKFLFGMEALFRDFPVLETAQQKEYVPFSELIQNEKEYAV